MIGRVAVSGMVLAVTVAAAVALTVCTSGRPAPVKFPAGVSERAVGVRASPSAAIPGQALVFDGQPGYGASGSAISGDAARFAYAHESSCPDARLVPRYGLRLQARWRYQGRTADLSAVQASFNESSSSIALPFMTITFGSAGSARHWVTSVIQGNRIKGYRSSGWVSLRSDYLATSPEPAYPDLRLQLWAGNPLTGKLYCAAATRLSIAPGRTYGNSASQ